MKKINLFVLLIALFTFSCEDLEEIGKNPNSVSETPPQLLLTEISENAFQVKGQTPMYAGRMIVSTAVENDVQYYKWNRGSYNEYNQLRDVKQMIHESGRVEKPQYEALGKFFRALYFYELTLTFGDIPFSQALKGESEKVYAPPYDTQEEVFSGILADLKEANDLINDEDIIEGDIIYNGDASKWRKLINAYRLKVLLTLSNKLGETSIDLQQQFANIVNNEPLINSNADNGQLEFFDQVGSRYGEYNDSDYGSGLYMDSTFIKSLQDHEDPRLFIYSTQTKNANEQGLATDDFSAYEGGNPIGQYGKNGDKAAAGKISKVSPRYVNDPTCEPHVVLGYSELQLILAEARVRGWINNGTAAEYYENGVRANFEFYNTYAEDYASYVDEQAANEYLNGPMVDLSQATSDEQKIQRIIMQKYFQSFLQGGWRMYFEKLRTGYPEFMEPEAGGPPTRWIYPQSEYQNNEENVSKAIKRQFGDGNDKIRAVPWWLK